jgi:hypothetical protein
MDRQEKYEKIRFLCSHKSSLRMNDKSEIRQFFTIKYSFKMGGGEGTAVPVKVQLPIVFPQASAIAVGSS